MGRGAPSAVDWTPASPHDARREGRHHAQALSRDPRGRRRSPRRRWRSPRAELSVRLPRLFRAGRRAAASMAAGRLADEYRRSGNWDFVRGDYASCASSPSPPPPQVTQRLDRAGRGARRGGRQSRARPQRRCSRSWSTSAWSAGSRRAPLRRLSSAADVSFQQEQLRSAWVIAALARGARGGAGAGAGARVPAAGEARRRRRRTACRRRLRHARAVPSRDELGRLAERLQPPRRDARAQRDAAPALHGGRVARAAHAARRALAPSSRRSRTACGR